MYTGLLVQFYADSEEYSNKLFSFPCEDIIFGLLRLRQFVRKGNTIRKAYFVDKIDGKVITNSTINQSLISFVANYPPCSTIEILHLNIFLSF